MTDALPSQAGQSHRAVGTGAYTFSDHRTLAVLTGFGEVPPGGRGKLARLGPHSRPRRGNGGTDGAFSACASARGPSLSGRVVVVPFQLCRDGRAVPAGSATSVAADSDGSTANGSVVARGRDPGGPDDGRVPVPRHYRARGPEPWVGLLALWTGQPAEGVDTPAGADRAGPGIGLAERSWMPVPGDAGSQLAPHDRHAQLIADHSPFGSPGRGTDPGGRVDPGDVDRVDTALREAEEEVGLKREHVTVLGQLDELDTVSQYRITPVVGVFAWPYPFTLSTTELSEVFGVPLRWLADPVHLETRQRHPLIPGRPIDVFYFHYPNHTVWGITARIILNLLEVVRPLL